jgi:hypothetical protein
VHPRGTQKNLLCKGKILKEFSARDKIKLAYFAGGKDLFTYYIIISASS